MPKPSLAGRLVGRSLYLFGHAICDLPLHPRHEAVPLAQRAKMADPFPLEIHYAAFTRSLWAGEYKTEKTQMVPVSKAWPQRALLTLSQTRRDQIPNTKRPAQTMRVAAPSATATRARSVFLARSRSVMVARRGWVARSNRTNVGFVPISGYPTLSSSALQPIGQPPVVERHTVQI